jgi:hypothetical protein
MRLLLIGCEYAGKTTLAKRIAKLITEDMGDPLPMHQHGWHDHFVLPFSSSSFGEADADAEQILGMKPELLEKFTRYLNYYHFQSVIYMDNHHLLTNWYYGDAIYAPMYYGYGARGEDFDRETMARTLDAEVMRAMTDMVLVLLKTSPDEIRRRKAEAPHEHCFIKEADVEQILERFDQEYTRSTIRRKFSLDTTGAPEETFQEFMRLMKANLSPRDYLRLQDTEYLK